MNKSEIQLRHKQFNFSFSLFEELKQNLQGYTFDKYLILKKIGRGSFATVYRAIILQTKQQVAIKIINLKEIHQCKNPRLKQIKLRLAHSQSRIIMSFNSNNIIKCYECFQSNHFKFMVLQFCNQGDLSTKIQKERKLFQDEAVSILKHIVNGIGECHRKKIIHRDLKPQNILIHNGIYKIADFGFSKMLQIKQDNQKCFNTCLGTPTTMAPQVKNQEPYGLKADIWSIGVIFFNMIFGKNPFERGNFNKVALRISTMLVKQQFYEDIKITQNVRSFLKQVLVVDPNERIGWKQLIQHKIFKQQQDEKLGSSFRRSVSIIMKEQQMIELEQKIVIKQGQLRKQEGQQIDVILKSLMSADSVLKQMPSNQISLVELKQKQQIKQKLIQMKNMIDMKECQSQILQSKFDMKQIDQYQIRAVNDQQKQLYQWAKRTHLQCLKTQLIHKKIILKIQTHKLLDLNKRKYIQFIYLLSTRCYNNMSPIYHQYQKYNKTQIMQQLTNNVSKLYKNVNVKWQRYSYLLTQKQNQKLQIISDWVKRNLKLFKQAYDYHTKQKFMTGVQSMGAFRRSYELYQDCKIQKMTAGSDCSDPVQLKDYTKQQQISFTIEYYKNCIRQKLNDTTNEQSKKIISLMDKYAEICNIKMQQVNKISFKEYIQNIMK